MKHYDDVEWLLYKNKALSDEIINEMEDHLYNCEACMDTFLSLIDEQEEALVEEIVPVDFTVKILENISKTKVIKYKPKSARKSMNNQIGYYAAVASVTIFLTFTGFYTNLVDAVPKIAQSIQEVKVRESLIDNVSNRIINSTSDLLMSIEENER